MREAGAQCGEARRLTDGGAGARSSFPRVAAVLSRPHEELTFAVKRARVSRGVRKLVSRVSKRVGGMIL